MTTPLSESAEEYEIGAYLDDVDDIRGRVEIAIGRKLSP